MAGVAEAVGPAITGFRPDNEVHGMVDCVGALRGTLAALIAADADLFARYPEHSSNSVRLEEWS